MKHIKLFALGTCLSAASAFANTCVFSIDTTSVKVGWTAYKTTQKTAVAGTLPMINVQGATEGKSFKTLVEGLKVWVDRSAVQTGNPARDVTLIGNFFKKIPGPSIGGSVHNLKGDEKAGTFTMKLSLGEKTKDVPMTYKTDTDGTLAATGSIDVLEFGLNDAMASLNKACVELHKGPDGVSKTWSEVGLNLHGKVTKVCK